MTVQIHSDIVTDGKRESLKKEESLELSYIESQLSEMGIPFSPICWTDRFLIAEKLQNYFARVIAKFSHIKRKNGEESQALKDRKLKWIELRENYAFFDFAQKQQLILNLMKENKYLSTLL